MNVKMRNNIEVVISSGKYELSVLFPQLVGWWVAAERATIKEGGRIISRLLLSLRLCGNTTTKRKRKRKILLSTTVNCKKIQTKYL